MSHHTVSNARGFVLVNALVLVAALSLVAVLLLSRAEEGRVRLMLGHQAAQLSLSLDAFDALALTLLHRDQAAGSLDHLGEAWALADYDVALDRGRVTGQISDQQGLFNVNWLANPEDQFARESFMRLMARQGVSPQVAEDIIAFLRPGGPELRTGYARMDPPLDPVGGAVLQLAQLRDIPAVSDRIYARLAPVLTALPGDIGVNVNTASSTVLASLLSDIPPAVLDRALVARRRSAYVSAAEFLTRLNLPVELEDGPNPLLERFSVSSSWFQIESHALLEGLHAKRQSLIQRLPAPQGSSVYWRVTEHP